MSTQTPKWIVREHEHTALLLYDDDLAGKIVVVAYEWPTKGQMERLREIARDCNSHDKLVEAMRLAIRFLDDKTHAIARHELKTALAAAGAKE